MRGQEGGDYSEGEEEEHTVESVITLFLLFIHLLLPSFILLNTPFPILLSLHINAIFLCFCL